MLDDLMINRPYALYCNDEIFAIITNPDPYGNIDLICNVLSEAEDVVIQAVPLDSSALGVLKNDEVLLPKGESVIYGE